MVHEIRADMVGNVLEVMSASGSVVAEGDAVALLESMKMEIPALTEVSGTVESVAVAPGSLVQRGDLIATVRAS